MMPDFIGKACHAKFMPDERRGAASRALQRPPNCSAWRHAGRHTGKRPRSVPILQQSVPSPYEDCRAAVTRFACIVQRIRKQRFGHQMKTHIAM
jgi:hypothetical protein